MTKTTLKVLGIVFLLIGVIGFFMSPILGLFPVNTLHNVIHIVSGLLCVYFGWMGSDSGAATFTKVFGVVYIIVALLGFFVPSMMMLLNMDMWMDNILHTVLGLIFLGVGMMKPKSASGNPMMGM